MKLFEKHCKNLIIGFGKGGKTLAAWLSKHGEDVILIEKSEKMYGGSCINIACIPTKSLITSAENAVPYSEAYLIKEELTKMFRRNNYDKLVNMNNVLVIDGLASFITNDSIKVVMKSREMIITADRIFINTGTLPSIPSIKGIYNKRIYNSTTLMELTDKPKHLIIVGGGFIGLEFADMFLKFGSKVTLLDNSIIFLPNEDRDIANEILMSLEKKGLQLISGASVNEFTDAKEKGVNIHYSKENVDCNITGDAVLIATGRIPNTGTLNLEAAGIETNERGYIKVNDKLQTTAKGIWAIGDINGGPQFTYISLDDFRIIKNQISGDTYNSVSQRKHVPSTLFISPPYARVGINEKEAEEKKLHYKIKTLSMAAIPKATISKQEYGLLKVIIEHKTGKILGCMLFCSQAQELIGIVQLAMSQCITYEKLRDTIYTHPSMAESFNDLFDL